MIDQNDPFYKIKLNLLLPLVSSIKFVFQAVKTKKNAFYKTYTQNFLH